MKDKVTIIPERIVKEVEEMKRIINAGYSVMMLSKRRTGNRLRQQLLQTENIPHEEPNLLTDEQTNNQAASREDTP